MDLKKFKFKKRSKIKLKRAVLSVLSVMMIILSISNINIFANGREEYFPNENYVYEFIGNRETKWDGYKVPGFDGLMATIINMDKTSTGPLYTYCIDAYTDMVQGKKYSIVNIEDAKDYEEYYGDENASKIRYIVANSFPFKNLDHVKMTFDIDTDTNLTIPEAVTATQYAIWHYSNNFKYLRPEHKVNDQFVEVPDNINNNIKKLYEKMIKKANANINVQVPVANIIYKDPIISKNEENSDNIDVKFIFKIDGKNYDNTDIKLMYEVKNKPASSEETYNVGEDGFTHVKINNIPLGTDIQIVVYGTQNLGNGGVYFLRPEGGKDVSQCLVGVKSGEINISKTRNYKFISTDIKLQATKKLTGKDLKEGMFNFKVYEGDKEVASGTNDQNGTIEFSPIIYNKEGLYTYIIKEEKGNDSDILYDETEFEVKVNVTRNNDGILVATPIYPEGGVVFNNTVKGSVKLIKVDKDNNDKKIEGAKFVLLSEDKETIVAENLVTDSKGEIIVSNLKPGKYYFKEIQASPGYELDDTLREVKVEFNQSEIATVIFENNPIKGSVKLIKVDKDNNDKKIEGAKFVLLSEDKETIVAENLVTDSEGNIIVSNLEPGTYYFKEIEAASGYILDDTLREVKVEFNQSEIATVIFENEKEKKEEVIKPVIKPNTNSPQTSDTSSITGYAISCIVSAGALVGINRKKKK